MNRNVRAAVLALVVAGGMASAAWAHCGSCPGDKPAGTSDKPQVRAACTNVMAQLNLTDEQKAKIAELRKGCPKDCSAEQRAKCMQAIQAVLTPEQQAKRKELMDKMGVKCPMACGQQAEKPKEEAQPKAPCCPSAN
jgi:Spy/CpxP family protein refolding chaperone